MAVWWDGPKQRAADLAARGLSDRPVPAGRSKRGWFWIRRILSQVRADLLFAILDICLIAASYAAMLLARFGGRVPNHTWEAFGMFLPVALAVHLLVGAMWGLYGSVWRYASIQEARRIIAAGLTTISVLLIINFWADWGIPISVVVLGGGVSLAMVGATRFQSRLFAVNRDTRGPSGLRTLVIGAGEVGAGIVFDMRRNRSRGFVPVGFLDDDPRKWGRSLVGVPVLGPLDELAEQIEAKRAHQVVLAIPTVNRDVIRQLADIADRAGVTLRVVPGMSELLGGKASLRDIRDVQIEDLLGREQVATDLEAVHGLLHKRRVLITGGGGSIGSELARQVAAARPSELILLDHDETHLYDTAGALTVPVVQVLADIRDRDRLADVFRFHRPQIVFHAAAHKHVPLLEKHPCEAAATNVLGTANVVRAAEAVGVERLVFISTDKAVRPANIMGATKRLGEQIVLSEPDCTVRRCAVRFGNVLGSRGSVIPTFMRQITAGGPVTLTDPRMRRFFMSIEEAVQLVLQAAALAEGGEIFMLEMGEQVRIVDLAARMVRLSGRHLGSDIELRVTGIRPGEKLSEELHEPDEMQHPTAHPSIVRLEPVMPHELNMKSTLEEVEELVRDRKEQTMIRLLLPDYESDRDGVDLSFEAFTG